MNLYKGKTMLGIVLAAMVYAVLRYNVFGNVDPQNIPVFILNKSLSLASVTFLLLAGLNLRTGDGEASKSWGTYSLHFALLHAAVSIVLLSQAYYPKFFADARMNLSGEFSTLFGVLGAYFYVLLRKNGHEQGTFVLIKFFAAVTVSAHLFFMGYSGWLKVADWQGSMPPISLISFTITLCAAMVYLSALIKGGSSDD